jgi:hypothetical protein
MPKKAKKASSSKMGRGGSMKTQAKGRGGAMQARGIGGDILGSVGNKFFGGPGGDIGRGVGNLLGGLFGLRKGGQVQKRPSVF